MVENNAAESPVAQVTNKQVVGSVEVVVPKQAAVLLPEVHIALPSEPSQATRRESGILLPRSTLFRDLMLGQPNKDAVILPTSTEVKQLAGGLSHAHDETKGASSEAILFFTSLPWRYFEQKLVQTGNESPIAEIRTIITKFKRKVAEISTESLILLRSPISSVRKQEWSRLKRVGFSESDLLAVTQLPETSLIDAASLEFVQKEPSEEARDNFYAFLSLCVSDLFEASDPNEDELKHLASVCQYLDVLTQTYLYHLGIYKLSNAALLETIAERLDGLTDKNLKIPLKYLMPLFNFLSYFEMNNFNASHSFLKILENNHYTHPLAYELKYQLGSEEEDPENQPKVGIELEVVPLVVFGGTPNGFELGVDGGGVMPEFRRSEAKLPFNREYRKELYDLWYFARTTQLRGASLHIHLDDPDEEKYKIFTHFLGDDGNTVYQSSFGTVELRFNLSSYSPGVDSGPVLDFKQPAPLTQYDLVPFIEALLQYAETQQLPANGAQTMPYYWGLLSRKQKELDAKKPLVAPETPNGEMSFEQVMQMAQSGENWQAIITALKQLKGNLSFEQVMQLSEELQWNDWVIFKALDKVNGTLTPDQVLFVSGKAQKHYRGIFRALTMLEGQLSFAQIMRLTLESNWDKRTLVTAMNYLDEPLSFDDLLQVATKAKWHLWITTEFVNKFNGTLNFQQCLRLIRESGWNYAVAESVFAKLDNSPSFEEIIQMHIEHKTAWATEHKMAWTIVSALIERLDESLSFDQVMVLASNWGWDPTLIRSAIAKLKSTLTVEQIMDILDSSTTDPTMVEHLMDKLAPTTPFEAVLALIKRLQWDRKTTAIIVQKFNGTLTVAQGMLVADQMYDQSNIIETVFAKMENKLSFEKLLQIVQSFSHNRYIISAAFKNLASTLTVDQAIQVLQASGHESVLSRHVFAKLETIFTFDQLIPILQTFDWTYYIASPALGSLKGTLTYDQFALFLDHCSDDGIYTILIAMHKLGETLTFAQATKIMKRLNWNSDIVSAVFEKLNISTVSRSEVKHYLATLRGNPNDEVRNKGRHVFIWTLLLKLNFQKPIRLSDFEIS